MYVLNVYILSLIEQWLVVLFKYSLIRAVQKETEWIDERQFAQMCWPLSKQLLPLNEEILLLLWPTNKMSRHQLT